jgi:HK97 gp10 family phage protein
MAQMTLSWFIDVEPVDKLVTEIEPASDRAANGWATEIARRAQDIVPVRTGNLRDSIHVERNGYADYAVVASAPYAGFVEFGTRYMAAEPYLGPAAADVDAAYVFGFFNPLLGDITTT